MADQLVPRPRSLPELADGIRSEFAAMEETVTRHAMRIGDMLIEAKAQLPHGGWGGWLAENFDLSANTAQGYMRLARYPDPQRVVGLSLRQALAQIAAPKGPRHHIRDQLTLENFSLAPRARPEEPQYLGWLTDALAVEQGRAEWRPLPEWERAERDRRTFLRNWWGQVETRARLADEEPGGVDPRPHPEHRLPPWW